ncbi:MAG: DNA mismatch repair protein MutS, partial [Isosphaeraceae bacterium]
VDQVVESMMAGREEYQLRQFFHVPLHDPRAVRYRHGVMRDLEKEPVLGAVQAFADRMRAMREQLAQARELRYRYQKERWFLDAAHTYGQAVSALTEDLASLDVTSRGFREFREYLADYTASDRFSSLVSATRQRYADLAAVEYGVHIRGNRVRVSRYDGEPDYSEQVEETFARFKEKAAKDYLVSFRDLPDMNHVEAQILELVARLYPEVYQALDDYCGRYQHYLDSTVRAFDREVQFYIAYLEFIAPLKRAGLSFCYPVTSDQSKHERAEESFDLALARKLVDQGSPVVCNDFALTGAERILVVSGPNQGGKTTFARMFGQLQHLAGLGLPVPGKAARLFLPDRVYTHFEREEDIATLRGKLEDELSRIHEILEQATGSGIVIMNESFTSTTLNDALWLGTEVMGRIVDRDLLCLYVTFVDELASLSASTVSMVSTIVPDNPAERTYKLVRRPADGLAYAAAIAEKYGLTFDRVKERIPS